MIKHAKLICLLLLIASCSKKLHQEPEKNFYSSQKIDFEQQIKHLKYLSSDELLGRKITQKGHKEAENYIINAFLSMDLSVQKQSFELESSNNFALNIYTEIKGEEKPEDIIVVTAHYDHIGYIKKSEKHNLPQKETNDTIFNGADDNASGVSCLIEMARYFKSNTPRHTIILLATDAEEFSLQGSKYFVKNYPKIKDVVLNINLDMISRNDNNSINVLTYEEELKTLFKEVQDNTNINLTFSHDKHSASKADDWTYASDHASFYKQNIPFVYFGVEDHPDYHQNSDEFEKIDLKFFERVSNFILNSTIEIDILMASKNL